MNADTEAAERLATIALSAAGNHAERVVELESEVSTLREHLAEQNRLLSLNVAEVERLRGSWPGNVIAVAELKAALKIADLPSPADPVRDAFVKEGEQLVAANWAFKVGFMESGIRTALAALTESHS
jgi:hypothetical protein